MNTKSLEVAHKPRMAKRVHYIDESGHDVLFNKHGKCIVGTPGCSFTFMLGVAELRDDPVWVSDELESLRAELLSDPVLRKKPSMQPNRRKTAICFHAKDDLPPVRERVFELCRQFDVRVHVAVRRKGFLSWAARNRAGNGGDYEAKGNNMYDNLVKRIASKRMRKNEHHHVVFARRNKSHKRKAIREALMESVTCNSQRKVTYEALNPHQSAGLQVVDYHLWAVQRMFERGDGGFLELVRHNIVSIHDIDDRRDHRHGRVYTVKNPISLERMKPVVSG